MWLCVEKRPSQALAASHTDPPTMPLMETVRPTSHWDPAPALLNRATPGGEWTCWSPTSSPPSSSPTEGTAVQKGSTGQRFTSATLCKTTVSQTMRKYKT